MLWKVLEFSCSYPCLHGSSPSPIRNIIFNYNQVTSDPDVRVPFSQHDLVRTCRFCIHLLDMLSQVTLLGFLVKDYGHSLRKGLNIDFNPGLILLNAGILSRMHFRFIVNVGPKRKVSECMPLTTAKMNFYASLT